MRKKYFIVILFLISCFCFAFNNSKNTTYSVVIEVLDFQGEPISYATLEFFDLNFELTTNAQGLVYLKLPKGSYKYTVKALGFLPLEQTLDVSSFSKTKVYLNRESIELEEFIIMAKYNSKAKDKAVINQTALSYIQPTSLVDALILLPGSLHQQSSLNQFSGVNFRSSGGDQNNALGVSIISNGVSMHNDGSRNQLYGLTQGSRTSFAKERNLVFNSGLDMRMISTDHIESISVVRGISSAKVGNLSSGQINLKAKQGVSPLQIRAKVDPNVQLAYLGKGIDLGSNYGVLHLGMDVLSSKPDVRETLTKFTRVTSQINHNLGLDFLGNYIELNTKLNYTQTLDNHKSDQSTEYNEELYKVKYHKLDFTWKASTLLDKKWIDDIELIAHFDYTKDVLDRSLLVYSDGGINMSNATQPGVHEAFFLPSKYKTSYQMDNAPLNVFLQFNAGKFWNLSDKITQNIIYGIEYNSVKNHGKGAVIDPNLPPFPSDNSFIRPRKNSSIPSLIHSAYYIESNIGINIDKLDSKIDLTTGLRGVQMFNLPSSYFLNNKVLVEPRLQMNFTTNYNSQQDIYTNFRIGYGQQNKLPTLDYLYPDRIYRDIEVLNWYDNLPENRLLLTHTFIHDVENPNLRASRAKKFEFGMDFSYKDFEFSLTSFYEKYDRGFEYHYQYSPVNYNKLTTANKPIVGKPSIGDFDMDTQHNFIMLPRALNSSELHKKGLEYRIVLPEIKFLSTSIEINGAYYKTKYGSNQPKMYYPKTITNNELYPYVGIYDNAPEITLSRLNTNVWFNTRIPRLKLVFTTFIQALWYTSSQLSSNESFVPSAYLDKTNTIHKIDYDKVKIDNPDLISLDLRNEKTNFSKDTTRPDFMVNFKGSKEIKNFGSISFFVNNILNLNSKYKNNYNVNQRKWSSAYFGVEVTLKLDVL
ncbi:TonB-dependent receptor [Myroides sp. LoEW2-1]|uniref:TonB-dependent receptor n=1 Tax=Myroides sp. LoEW2-1 TaxID=2683192 RepID=UPI0013254B99|nr:TonB-dependent receptor [Myroides sp. LoEW2-1]MVX36850.1 TonB-dependent receptor [Myroides sp. LoEW2-1]